MWQRVRDWVRGRKFGVPLVGGVALSFLVAGFLVATGTHWVGASQAAGIVSPTKVEAPGVAVPASFADLATRLSPAVVNIRVNKMEKVAMPAVPDTPFGENTPFGDFFRRFFKDMPHQHQMQGAGSGFIISPDGYILTNNHVVEGAQEVTVTLADKQEYKARIVGRDSRTDLAVLKISPKGTLPAVTLGNSEAARVGDWVLAIGNPYGLSNTVTAGIVSAKGRVIGQGPYDDFIQTDAPINPENSGGPLFNLKGEVVGVNTAIFSQSGGSVGIGFAIPIDEVKPLIPQLETTGHVTRGYLGVTIQSITPDLQKAMNLSQAKGALVADVVKGSPAERAGIQRGDVITAFSGKPVADSTALPPLVAAMPVGKTVPVTLIRDGKTREVQVAVGKFPVEEAVAQAGPEAAHPRWGLQLETVTPALAGRLGLDEEHGVLVAGVVPGSPADDAGIHQGDVILEADRQPVKSVEDVRHILAKAKDQNSVLLLVKRQDRTLFAALTAK